MAIGYVKAPPDMADVYKRQDYYSMSDIMREILSDFIKVYYDVKEQEYTLSERVKGYRKIFSKYQLQEVNHSSAGILGSITKLDFYQIPRHSIITDKWICLLYTSRCV